MSIRTGFFTARLPLLAVCGLSLFVSSRVLMQPVFGQQIDAAVMAKFQNAKVVHYHLEGVYQGRTIIAYKEDGGQANVTDKVSIDLDWDTKTKKMIGVPKIVNSKTTIQGLFNVEATCPKPVPAGDYEHMEATQLTATGTDELLELRGTTSFPQIQVTAYCQGSWAKKMVAAKQAPISTEINIFEAGMVAFPSGMVPDLTVAADHKSFTFKLDKWTWTYTPTVVR
jgi:hypothetical protein